jgi:hypothetical protein
VAEEANVECGCKSPLTEVHSKSNGRRGQIGWKNLKQNFKAHHRDSSESRQWAFSIPNIHSDDTFDFFATKKEAGERSPTSHRFIIRSQSP